MKNNLEDLKVGDLVSYHRVDTYCKEPSIDRGVVERIEGDLLKIRNEYMMENMRHKSTVIDIVKRTPFEALGYCSYMVYYQDGKFNIRSGTFGINNVGYFAQRLHGTSDDIIMVNGFNNNEYYILSCMSNAQPCFKNMIKNHFKGEIDVKVLNKIVPPVYLLQEHFMEESMFSISVDQILKEVNKKIGKEVSIEKKVISTEKQIVSTKEEDDYIFNFFKEKNKKYELKVGDTVRVLPCIRDNNITYYSNSNLVGFESTIESCIGLEGDIVEILLIRHGKYFNKRLRCDIKGVILESDIDNFELVKINPEVQKTHLNQEYEDIDGIILQDQRKPTDKEFYVI